MGLLIALMCGAQAEELVKYNKDIGPYAVSFSLPELHGGPVEFVESIDHIENGYGADDDEDEYNIHIYSDGLLVGFLTIHNYKHEYDFESTQENLENQLIIREGCTVTSANREIDGIKGTVIEAHSALYESTFYVFSYHKYSGMDVEGRMNLRWDQVLPLLDTLDVTDTVLLQELVYTSENEIDRIKSYKERIDYSYEIGPYMVSTNVPKIGTPIHLEFDKDISKAETPDGAVHDRYVINMICNGVMGTMTIRAFEENVEYDPEQYLKTQINASDGFVRYEDSEIDGTVGTIAYVRDLTTHAYSLYFAYQKDNRTTVDGVMKFPWENSLPFVENLNITKIAELPPRSMMS